MLYSYLYVKKRNALVSVIRKDPDDSTWSLGAPRRYCLEV